MSSQRTPLIAGNWKMHKTRGEAVETVRGLIQRLQGLKHPVEAAVAPPFTALDAVSKALRDSEIGLAAQDLFWEPEGAYTGQISAAMLCDVGCRYAIVGHSERRQYFGETDETVNRKISVALKAGLQPIFCIGETKTQRLEGKTFSVLDKQLRSGLKDFVSDDLSPLVIAYEPVWAIGTGLAATSDQAQEVHEFIRGFLEKKYGISLANTVRILYGGSVKPDNVKELMACPDIDGALVGGASLQAESFARLVRYQE